MHSFTYTRFILSSVICQFFFKVFNYFTKIGDPKPKTLANLKDKRSKETNKVM